MSSLEEHLATRRAAGLFDFSFMALYEFSGLDALQGLQTRDLRQMRPGQIFYTLLLKDDGAVLIDATVWRLDAERFWLFTGKRVAAGGREQSGRFAVLALQGPDSGRILAHLVGREAVLGLEYFHWLETDAMLIGRLGFSGELGYELLVPAAQGPALRRSLLDYGIVECGWDAADSLRIESGYVLFDREIDGLANPRELGLERLVSDRSVAFPLARRLVGLELLEEPAPASPPAASVTSECFSPALGKTIALGYVDPRAAPGTAICLIDGRIARVRSLPFYDADRRRPRARPL